MVNVPTLQELTAKPFTKIDSELTRISLRGQKIKKLREGRGVDLSRAAKTLKVKERNFIKMENGEMTVDDDVFENACYLYGYRPWDIDSGNVPAEIENYGSKLSAAEAHALLQLNKFAFDAENAENIAPIIANNRKENTNG